MGSQKVCTDVLIKIISQFTTQDPALVYNEICKQPKKAGEDAPFVVKHGQAILFYKAFTYIRDAIVIPHLNMDRPWDPDNAYLVRLSRELIIQEIENNLRTLTNDLDIECITALSGEKQEKRTVKNASIAVVPYIHYANMNNEKVLLDFCENNRRELHILHAHAVRKQLDLTTGGSLVICKEPSYQGYKTFGVITTAAAAQYPRFKLDSYLCWSFCMPDVDGSEKVLVQYRRGALTMPLIELKDARWEELENNLKEHKSMLSEDEFGYLARMVQTLTTCKKGAILILARKEDIEAEARRLAGKNRGVQLSSPISINGENGEPDVDILSRLSSIDGAILADFTGQCYAFGVILDGVVIKDGNPDRGSRFNSTKTYIENRVCDDTGNIDTKRAPFFGIIRSDDGMINIRWGQADGRHGATRAEAVVGGKKC